MNVLYVVLYKAAEKQKRDADKEKTGIRRIIEIERAYISLLLLTRGNHR
jgi:hypothetical protein